MRKVNRKIKKKTYSQLKHEADRVFSIFIRNRDKRCFTCGAIQNLQAGHFVSRSWSALRYAEDNVHAQCSNCNVWRRGNYSVYALNLVKKYGQGILEDLEKRKVITQLKSKDLEKIIAKYKLTNLK